MNILIAAPTRHHPAEYPSRFRSMLTNLDRAALWQLISNRVNELSARFDPRSFAPETLARPLIASPGHLDVPRKTNYSLSNGTLASAPVGD